MNTFPVCIIQGRTFSLTRKRGQYLSITGRVVWRVETGRVAFILPWVPKTRWKDVCKRDMQTVGLREGDAGDRAYWKEMINNHSGDPR